MNRSKRSLVVMLVGVAAAAALWPSEALAQRRVVRRPAVRVGVAIGYPYYYSPFYYDPFFYDTGWGPYYQYPPYGRYPPYPYRGFYEAASDLRIQVTPRDAEVYVDGYLVGNVDNFDGVLQRLRVPYGEHEITVYKEGFRTVRQRMLFRPGESYRIRETMQQLGAGDAAEPRPLPSERPDPGAEGPQGPPPGPPRGRPQPLPPAERDRGERGQFGTLSIRVQPGDAEILVDGEKWEGASGDSRLLVEVSEGTHRVEIRKPGFRPYSSTVRVRRGETVPLNVSLPQGD